MNEPSIIILCAGKQTRWQLPMRNGEVPPSSKHFISIWGEPLIKRMLRQLPIVPIIIGNTPELRALKTAYLHPDNTRNKASSILYCLAYWNHRNIILLGDVLFTEQTLLEILNCPDEVAFFGRGSELFAMTFDERYYDQMMQHLREASKVKDKGNLWDIYKLVIGVPPDSDERDSAVFHEVKEPLTRDFDWPDQYQQFCKEFPEPV